MDPLNYCRMTRRLRLLQERQRCCSDRHPASAHPALPHRSTEGSGSPVSPPLTCPFFALRPICVNGRLCIDYTTVSRRHSAACVVCMRCTPCHGQGCASRDRRRPAKDRILTWRPVPRTEEYGEMVGIRLVRFPFSNPFRLTRWSITRVEHTINH